MDSDLWAKAILGRVAKQFGYRIERIEELPAPLDVFSILIELMKAREKDVFFLQVGANDGVSNDPIREHVLANGWKGLLLEPQPATFKRLVDNYRMAPQLVFENAVIADKDGAVSLYTTNADGLGSLRKDVLTKGVIGRKVNQMDTGAIQEIAVQALSFSTLFKKHDVQKIDLLQIDTEGYDFQVLKMFDFSRFKPILIRYENVHLSNSERQECTSFLASLGYRLIKVDIDVVAYRPG